MTLAIPDKLHKFMKEHKEIIWAEVVRRSLWGYFYKIQRMEKREAERETSENNIFKKPRDSEQQNFI